MSAPIVVGIDGSPGSRRAVLWGADEAARRRAPLTLVHAFGIPDAFYGETMPPKDWLDIRQAESRSLLREAAELAGRVHPELEIDTESTVDAPIPFLLGWSERAKLLVLGCAGRGEFGDLLLGSTAASVSARSRCPLVVVRGKERGAAAVDDPVVVGVDGSPEAEAAIELAFEEASLRKAPLVAVHTWSDADTRQVFSAARAEFSFEPLRESETRVLAEALAGWEEKYPEVGVRRVVAQDRPRHELLEWSTKAQLMVVGSRGRGGFRGLLLGSTSHALLEHAECPVLLVRSA
ncbi:universal stress protein [Amycolatopsis rhizosphaerae]|uniref:Universal stress protein n=1 Tax=Amycolatopsis rhizosphaerae TaxID=2053003 RepID=A0A558B2A1_9PSEU|nr:universal stress protein [Amycolatopsis rhizosphaerae]TVT30638.1 universal stress protein [Amycolatopsis rhizosphaerae]